MRPQSGDIIVVYGAWCWWFWCAVGICGHMFIQFMMSNVGLLLCGSRSKCGLLCVVIWEILLSKRNLSSHISVWMICLLRHEPDWQDWVTTALLLRWPCKNNPSTSCTATRKTKDFDKIYIQIYKLTRNMEPTHHPFRKENDLPTSMIMFHVNLQGCTSGTSWKIHPNPSK